MQDQPQQPGVPELFEQLLCAKTREAVPVSFAIEHLGFQVGEFPKDQKEVTWMELLVKQLVTKAARGDGKTLAELMDRLLGRVGTAGKADGQVHNTYIQFLNSCLRADDGGLGPRLIIDQPLDGADGDELGQFFNNNDGGDQ